MGFALAGKSVLVVEDEALVAIDLAQMLGRNGAQVVGPAGTLTDALFALEQRALDAAVLDVNLQGEFVTPVADLLARRNVPFVFATGYERAQALPARLSGRPLLRKPYSEPELLAAVLALLPAAAPSAAA